jgi:type I restriction enzyme, S subunit
MSYDNWKMMTLQDVCTKIGDGLHGTPNYSEDGDYYFINGNNLDENIIINAKTRKVDQDEFEKYRKDLSLSTILLSINGTLGNLAYYQNEKVVLGKSVCYINTRSDVYKRFIYYSLKTPEFLMYLDSHSTGTTIKNFGLKAVREYKFRLPSFENQIAIANTLYSFDNKIELNNKINKNLEELAQTLYKHWFVDFEFPNEEGKPYKSSGGEMVESELGMIPKGWVISQINDNEYSISAKPGIDSFSGEKIYIATADVKDTKITNLNTKITLADRPSRANMQPRQNSIWFAKMKDSRKLIRFGESSHFENEFVLSTGFAGIVCSFGLDYFWTFLQSTEFDNAKNNLSNGTTMEAINNSGISLIKVVIPDKKTLSTFSATATPLYEMIELNNSHNNKLAGTRDLILPKLMSGEIEV